MNIVFVVPRLHTNLINWFEVLIARGDKVKVYTLYSLAFEENLPSYVEEIGYSKIFLFIKKIFKKKNSRSIKNNFDLKYGFLSILYFLKVINKINPDVVVVRDIQSLNSLIILFISRVCRIKSIVIFQIEKYCQ